MINLLRKARSTCVMISYVPTKRFGRTWTMMCQQWMHHRVRDFGDFQTPSVYTLSEARIMVLEYNRTVSTSIKINSKVDFFHTLNLEAMQRYWHLQTVTWERSVFIVDYPTADLLITKTELKHVGKVYCNMEKCCFLGGLCLLHFYILISIIKMCPVR